MADALDPVVQRFVADTRAYVAGLAAATVAADRFAKSALDAAAAVELLQGAVDGLHGRTVTIGVDAAGLAAAAAAGKSAAEAARGDAVATTAAAAASDLAAGAATRQAEATLAAAGASKAATGAAFGFWHWMGLAHNVMTVFGANVIADTVGIVAFGAAATAAVAPVVTSLNSLGTSYSALDSYQKAAALSLNGFIHGLSNGANEAGIFTVFNQGLSMIESRLSSSGGVVHQATVAFEDFFAMLSADFSSAPWAALFSRQSGAIRQDMDMLFTTISNLVNVIPALMHDFNGLGIGVLSAANDVLRFVAWVGNSNPALMQFASGVLLVWHAWSLLARVTPIPALGSLIGRMGLLGGGVAGLTGAFANFRRFGLVPTLSLMTGLSPAVLAASSAFAAGIGAVALADGALIYATRNVRSSTDNLIASLARQTRASGYNAAGYAALSKDLASYTSSAQHAAGATYALATRNNPVIGSTYQMSAAQRQAAQTAQALTGNFSYLSRQYGMTRQQALAAANATGVNLTRSLTASGTQAAISRAKLQAYAATVQGAENPMSQLAVDSRLLAQDTGNLSKQVQDLTDAYNALLTPFANTVADTATWRTDQRALAVALEHTSRRVGYHTALQRAAAQALATSITDTTNLSTAVLQQTGSVDKSIRPLQQEITYLRSLHSHSSIVAQAIAYLREEINKLRSKKITITTQFLTQGAIPNSSITNPQGKLGGPGGSAGVLPGSGAVPRGAAMAGGGVTVNAPVTVHAGSGVNTQALQQHVQGAILDYFTRNPGTGLLPLGRR